MSIQLRAGRLRHSLTLQEASRSTSSMGAVTESWSNVNDGASPPTDLIIYSEVMPVTAKEIISGDQITQDTTHVVRTRHLPDQAITPSMRFTWGDRVFNIEKVINVRELDTLLEITVIEQL